MDYDYALLALFLYLILMNGLLIALNWVKERLVQAQRTHIQLLQENIEILKEKLNDSRR